MMEHLMTWIGPALDVAAVGLLALVLWRLGGDPSAAWSERETRLQAIFDDLRGLVAQSEGLARDLDEKLAARETRLKALLAEAAETLASPRAAVPPAPAERSGRIEVRDDVAELRSPAPAAPVDPAVIAERIEALANDGVAVEEIARRVGVAAAEVRLVIGLKAARVARRRNAVTEERAHA
jgi:hypothetical protein